MAKKKTPPSKRHQAVILTMSDGRTVTFHGPEQVFHGDVVSEIMFSEAVDLPVDCSWASVIDITEDLT